MTGWSQSGTLITIRPKPVAASRRKHSGRVSSSISVASGLAGRGASIAEPSKRVGSAGGGIYAWAANTVGETSRPPTDGKWQPFNLALLDQALKDGRPVVVDWGANWCINCRVLEARVLRAGAVEEAFLRSNAVLLRADETVENPPTTLLNSELGGQSIPVLAIFSPGRPVRPVVLRDNYSAQRVVEELQKAGVGKGF